LTRTDGVPLFVEELTKTVLESGLLRERDGHYTLDQPLPPVAIPTTLQASLLARLDRLASVRDVAQIGAVVGREFSYELLNAVAGLPQQRLDDALRELVRSELVFRRGEIPQAVYTFKHALVRDAAYSSLLKTRRAQLHAAIAGALESRFPELIEVEPETLAGHLTEAGLFDKAVRYWLLAGRNAAMRSANLEAIAHLQRGIDAVAALPDEAADRDRMELDLQLALAPCLIATQGPASSAAMATFTRAGELCERLGDPPEYLQVVFWLTTASVIRGELPRAEEMIVTLLRLAETRGERPALLNALRGHAMILLFMGRVTEARAAIERAAAAFDASGEADRLAARAAGQDAGVANLALMSWTLWLLGDVDTAAARMEEAFRRADSIGHPHTRAYAAYYASVLHALRGDPVLARRHAERCLALSEEHGFRQWRGLSRAVRGICTAMIDPAATSIEEVTSALDEYRGAGYQLGITALYVLLCRALILIQKSGPALEIIEQGLATAEHNSERIFEAELYRLKAELLRASGASTSDTTALLEHALAVARSQGARSLELRAATDLAALLAGEGDPSSAIKLLAPACAQVTEGNATRDLREAQALLARLR
jgi:tetratricopeptide (TPR) repeat protein